MGVRNITGVKNYNGVRNIDGFRHDNGENNLPELTCNDHYHFTENNQQWAYIERAFDIK